MRPQIPAALAERVNGKYEQEGFASSVEMIRHSTRKFLDELEEDGSRYYTDCDGIRLGVALHNDNEVLWDFGAHSGLSTFLEGTEMRLSLLPIAATERTSLLIGDSESPSKLFDSTSKTEIELSLRQVNSSNIDTILQELQVQNLQDESADVIVADGAQYSDSQLESLVRGLLERNQANSTAGKTYLGLYNEDVASYLASNMEMERLVYEGWRRGVVFGARFEKLGIFLNELGLQELYLGGGPSLLCIDGTTVPKDRDMRRCLHLSRAGLQRATKAYTDKNRALVNAENIQWLDLDISELYSR